MRRLKTLGIIMFFAAAAVAFVTLVVLTLQAAAERIPADWDPPQGPSWQSVDEQTRCAHRNGR